MTTFEIIWLIGGILIFLAPMIAGYKDASGYDGMTMTFVIAVFWPFVLASAIILPIIWALFTGFQKGYAYITHRMAAFWGVEQ